MIIESHPGTFEGETPRHSKETTDCLGKPPGSYRDLKPDQAEQLGKAIDPAAYRSRWTSNSGVADEFRVFKDLVAPYEKVMVAEILQALKATFISRLNILEIGCGAGFSAGEYLGVEDGPSVRRYVGVDICRSSLVKFNVPEALLRPGVQVDLICGDISQISLKPSQFDFLIAHHSVYGIQPQGIRELLGLVKPGGIAVFILNSKKSILYRIAQRLSFPLLEAERVASWLQLLGVRYLSYDFTRSFTEVLDNCSKLEYFNSKEIPLNSSGLTHWLATIPESQLIYRDLALIVSMP